MALADFNSKVDGTLIELEDFKYLYNATKNRWDCFTPPVILDGAPTVNGVFALQEIRTSDYITDGGALQIPANYWIWSDDTSVPALLVDTPNATIINEGRIIGKGGAGGSGFASAGGAGGPAIDVIVTGVSITGEAGSFIAGGGGGGGSATGSGDKIRMCGGGGGAGGGRGGNGSDSNGGAGGALNATGANGAANAKGFAGGYGGGSGGGGGYAGVSSTDTNYANTGGGGGGRILPGTGGAVADSGAYTSTGHGGSGGNAGSNGAINGNRGTGGGGGGWGAKGGNGDGAGGAAGAAISGNAVTLTNNGTIYGAV